MQFKDFSLKIDDNIYKYIIQVNKSICSNNYFQISEIYSNVYFFLLHISHSFSHTSHLRRNRLYKVILKQETSTHFLFLVFWQLPWIPPVDKTFQILLLSINNNLYLFPHQIIPNLLNDICRSENCRLWHGDR